MSARLIDLLQKLRKKGHDPEVRAGLAQMSDESDLILRLVACRSVRNRIYSWKRQPFEDRSFSAEDLSFRTIRQMTITATRLRAERVAANHTQNQSNL